MKRRRVYFRSYKYLPVLFLDNFFQKEETVNNHKVSLTNDCILVKGDRKNFFTHTTHMAYYTFCLIVSVEEHDMSHSTL